MVYKGGFFSTNPMKDIENICGSSKIIPSFHGSKGYYVMSESGRFFFVNIMKSVIFITERKTYTTKSGEKVRLSFKGKEFYYSVNELKRLTFGIGRKEEIVEFPNMDMSVYSRFKEVVKILVYYGESKEDAEDAAETSFLELAFCDHRPKDYFPLWVWMARKRAIDQFDHIKRNVALMEEDGYITDKPYEVDFLQCLSEQRKMIMKLTIEGFEYAEIGKKMGICSSSVRSEVCRAIKQIRQRFRTTKT